MLETHLTDLRIVETLAAVREGCTTTGLAWKVARWSDRPVSIHTIKRHLPGLIRLGLVRGDTEVRDGAMVTVWRAVSKETGEGTGEETGANRREPDRG